ncbi:hypothetical protein CVV68_19590 [Arthrobacter livingstonensis]|uniref:Di-and tripeptidase n=1 Tax=Arthrobacter livingstonensis TaxID=670078 RepID=A0A2V5L1P1_9MICC|nr:hypothetical protein [Arthrobacter livingstonensis]PYI65129.1 hypothetical protein CVV68_19590 [Arthrobacter livingstonensis]
MARKDVEKTGTVPGRGFGKSARKPNPAVGLAAAAAFDERGKPKPAVHNMLLRAVEVQRPLVLANLRRLRKKHPEATAFELSRRLERDFLNGVGTGGAAIGATAIIPGVGTVAALSISAAATVVFLEATALYAQSVAELHGVRLADPERAQLTVMAIILGDEGTAMLAGLTGHALGNGRTPMQAWGKTVSKSMPISAVKGIAVSMQKKFLRKVAVRGGASVVGKALPFGVGAAVGGVGNYMMGRAVIASTKRAFGPAPLEIPEDLRSELDAPKEPKALKASRRKR